jgi:hypothetical protein
MRAVKLGNGRHPDPAEQRRPVSDRLQEGESSSEGGEAGTPQEGGRQEGDPQSAGPCLRIVLDSNVVLSGFFFAGIPGIILQGWRAGRFTLVIAVDSVGVPGSGRGPERGLP